MMDFDEADCLAVDPFAGDFGSPGDKTFRDKMVTCLVGTKACDGCGSKIELRTRYRTIVAKFDGQLHQYRYCTHCCAAMAKSWKDEGRAWEKRLQLRDQHA